MEIETSVFLTFAQFNPGPLQNLSTLLDEHGIDSGQFFTLRMTDEGIFVEQVRNACRLVS